MTSINDFRDHPQVMKTISREKYLKVVSAALEVENYHFAREAVLNWLATYPGDLLAGLYYAQALVGENRISQALPVLIGLCMADPEFVGAVKTLTQIADIFPDDFQASKNVVVAGSQRQSRSTLLLNGSLASYWYALTGEDSDFQALDSWGEHLWLARQAIDRGEINQAEPRIKEALGLKPDHPLTCVCHLKALSIRSDIPLEIKSQTARNYHNQWPDCLASMLWLADWSMEGGDSAQAVALLHQAAARDVGGQVSERLWGDGHPYRCLWPERLELALNTPIPADVAVVLGWNRLLPGIQEPVNTIEKAEDQIKESDPLQIEKEALLIYGVSAALDQPETLVASENIIFSSLTDSPIEESEEPAEIALTLSEDTSKFENAEEEFSIQGELHDYQWALEPEIDPGENSHSEDSVQEGIVAAVIVEVQGKGFVPDSPKPVPPGPIHQSDLDIEAISNELDLLAGRMNLPGLTHLDGRFPVYVILTGRSKLQAIYGFRTATIIESEMNLLVETVRGRRGWGALLFLADDPVNSKALGIQPADLNDPWELKLALRDLDDALRKKGQRIGVVLIVGGPEIIPFHHLPNPVDDQDVDVPSDNPYATRNENYFIPEWPVGRLPGGAGENAEILVNALRSIRQYHEKQSKQLPWYKRYIRRLRDYWEMIIRNRSQNFGYTAAIWQKMAAQVFRPIGKPKKLYVSPPTGYYPSDTESIGTRFSINGSLEDHPAQQKKHAIPTPKGRLAYFNLHGIVDAKEWFGQRDLSDQSDEPDYPIALRPEDIRARGSAQDNEVPQVVFSEACYGLHIQGRSSKDAISLRFLEAGSLAVVGSTCMAYGSIQEPLTAADLLGHTFWNFLKQGMTTGEALRHAKIYLAGEMNRRQGYLDGEDQKTLISFVLYGDPLVQPMPSGRALKITRYQEQPLSEIRTVCDRMLTPESPLPIPKEVYSSVMKVVSQYLPGMSDAQFAYTLEREQCSGEEHLCPTSQLDSKQEKIHKSRGTSRRVVLLSKHVTLADGILPQYARFTLDEEGDLVKLVVSR